MTKVTHEFDLYGKHYVLESGELAKQATGACLVKCGDSTVLMTVVVSKERKDYDFFPPNRGLQREDVRRGPHPRRLSQA